MSELVVDARILVYRVTVGLVDFEETRALDDRLLGASTLFIVTVQSTLPPGVEHQDDVLPPVQGRYAVTQSAMTCSGM